MSENLYDSLLKSGLTVDEINQFLKAYEKGIYLPRYVKDVNVMRKMREVCSKHDYKFTVNQQKVILDAIRHNVDPTPIANPEYSEYVMKQIYCGLVKGVDITKYKGFDKNAEVAAEVRLALQHNLPDASIKALIKASKDCYCDLYEVRFCLEEGVPIEEINKIKSSYGSEYRELRKNYKAK